MFNSQLARGPRTLLTGVVLLGIYAIYARLTSPWLNIERTRQTMSASQDPVVRTADFGPILSQWFPQDQWVGHAGKKFRDGDRYLVFNDFSLFNENHSVQVSPVAMLWSDGKPDSVPVRVTAASAQLDRSTAFEIEQTEFGRITSGFLSGDVRMDGPDGLHIEGRNFYISEKSMKIWSGSPVNLVWQTHQARAEGGIEIQLLTAPQSEEGLLAITDIQSLRLNGRVTCDLMLPDKHQRREPTHLTVHAANGFEFSVQTLTATFFGFEDKVPQPGRQILVQRLNSSGAADRLLCTQLTLQMQPAVESEPSSTLPGTLEGSRPRRVELASILAEGSRVVVYLQEQDVTATMTSLRYTPDQQRLELWDQKSDPQGRPYPVRIHQDGTEVLVPHVLIQHGDGGQLHSIQLRGPGLIRHAPMPSEEPTDPSEGITRNSSKGSLPGDADSIEAMWKKSCVFFQSPHPRVVLEGDAQILQTERQFRLLGQKIDLLLHSSEPAGQVTEPYAVQPAASSPSEMSTAADLNFAHIRPQKLIATDRVRISAPQVTGSASKKLTVLFPEATEADAVTTDAAAGTRATAVSSTGSSGAGLESLAENAATTAIGFTHFSAETMEASIATHNSGEAARHDWSDIWLRGSVEIDYTAAEADQSFHASGNVLFARNGFADGRGISLFGSPAAIVSASRRIEGQRIDLEEETARVAVEGSGRIRLVVDQGLDGRPLEKPSPLDIYWAESMSFRDRTAQFTGSIRAVLTDGQTHEIELTCAGMKVLFADKVQLLRQKTSDQTPAFAAQSATGNARTNISRIECESRVHITLDQMMAGIVTAQHAADFSDLKVDLQSGDFEASGPGWIQSTQPDRGNRLKVAPGIVATANQPVRTSENPFVYVNATFIGSLNGNLNREFVQLNQHVDGIFGPVRRLGETIQVNVVSSDQLPPQSGVLRCERLSVVSLPGPDSEHRTFSLTAEQNARIESRQLDGHADKITYDHSKQQFILRSEGNHNATVSHRQTDQGNLRTLVGQQFEYYPQLNKLKANQIIGLNATE